MAGGGRSWHSHQYGGKSSSASQHSPVWQEVVERERRQLAPEEELYLVRTCKLTEELAAVPARGGRYGHHLEGRLAVAAGREERAEERWGKRRRGRGRSRML